jgi:hypothetical protein
MRISLLHTIDGNRRVFEDAAMKSARTFARLSNMRKRFQAT